MPFRSKAQQRFLFATNPKAVKKVSADMSKKDFKRLPERAEGVEKKSIGTTQAMMYGAGTMMAVQGLRKKKTGIQKQASLREAWDRGVLDGMEGPEKKAGPLMNIVARRVAEKRRERRRALRRPVRRRR